MTKGSTHSCSNGETRRDDEEDKKNMNTNTNTNTNTDVNTSLESAFKRLKVDNDNHPRRKSRHPFALKKFHPPESSEQRRSLIHPARLKRFTRKESDKTSASASTSASSSSSAAAAAVGEPCTSSARTDDNDVTMDELASYFENFVHIPKKMSTMAEMMYT